VYVVGEWQVLQSSEPGRGTCAGWVAEVTIVTPTHDMPAAWQVAQAEVRLTWFIAVPGPNEVVEAWQTLQSSPLGIGKCAGDPVGVSLIVNPAAAANGPVPAPWHVAQLAVSPVCTIV
jgi:hypothetical protein